jgi:DNA-binding response OmpR family regulator
MKKLLLIEDDTDAREMITFTFENNGSEVIRADKEISMQEVSAIKPNIIVIGYQLNGMPGNDICLKLKADKLTMPIPVILYSATLDIEKIPKNNCADGIVAKPFELEDLVYLVNRIALLY